jgi:hypothetical protein
LLYRLQFQEREGSEGELADGEDDMSQRGREKESQGMDWVE